MSAEDYIKAIMAEFERLGLSIDEWPSSGIASAGRDPEATLAAWLAHLRGLLPGVSWHEADPELPAHWIPGRPDTWTTPYVPLGAYDYQTLPTGPAVHVSWKRGGSAEALADFVTEARTAGLPVYGAGPIDELNGRASEYDAHVVLEAGTSYDGLDRFLAWLEARGEPAIATVPRTGYETYLE